jgi:hypothetical protein
MLAPLEDAIAGCKSQDSLIWTESLRESFAVAQRALSSNKTIVLPLASDQIWIVTDGSVKQRGVGATMYVSRHSKLHLAGFFSAKLRQRQVTWLPCEVEALSIAVATKHFSPYLIQSKHNACILTDSKPCVQAFEKLCRGEFSTSPRVSTFLSTVSRYQASVRHLSGLANVPSDFASRNAPECDNLNCQVCSFVRQTEDSVVRQVTAQEVISGKVKIPFANRTAWGNIQADCSDLRRTRAHLLQGTRPSKKLTNIKDVKRYLNVATIAKDGLLVVQQSQPLAPVRERIIIPRDVVSGLLTALHLQLDHPSVHQLKQVTHRYFYALDLDKYIEHACNNCSQCAALRNAPHVVVEQTSSHSPSKIGVSFAADIIKRERQLILVLRETVTSFTVTCLVENERRETLRDALIHLCIELRPLDGPLSVIRTDPAPGFKALVNDELLHRHRINVEVGRVKNINKNPVAEKAVRELEDELLRQDPSGGFVSPLSLSIATSSLNSRIRSQGLSARELWTQRDQFTNDQLPISDWDVIRKQHNQRSLNHPHSEKAKTPSGKVAPDCPVNVGDLVYLYCDRNKTCARDRYLVVQVEGAWCNVQKFKGKQLRSASYRIKRSECYKVPGCSEASFRPREYASSDGDSDVEESPIVHKDNQEETERPLHPPIGESLGVSEPVIPSILSTPEPVHNAGAIDSHSESPLSNDNIVPDSSLNVPSEVIDTGPRRSTRKRVAPQRYQDPDFSGR